MARSRLSAEERRAQILSAAHRLFDERGLENVSVSDIVREIGVAQGTFYWHFPSKDALVDAVVAQVGDAMVAGIEQVVAGPGSALEKFAAMRDMALGVVGADRDLYAHFHRDGNEEMHARLTSASTERLTPLVARVIRQGAEEGVFRVTHADEAAVMASAVAQSVDVERLLADPGAIERYQEALTEFVLRALGASEHIVEEMVAAARREPVVAQEIRPLDEG